MLIDLQENELRRMRAAKKADEGRNMVKVKDKELERYVLSKISTKIRSLVIPDKKFTVHVAHAYIRHNAYRIHN
jgi:hypothetical protein